MLAGRLPREHDVTGTVAWQLAGQAPRRHRGYGTIPLPGWEDGAGWEPEAVPFEQMPHLEAPACGFVSTAPGQTPTSEGARPGPPALLAAVVVQG